MTTLKNEINNGSSYCAKNVLQDPEEVKYTRTGGKCLRTSHARTILLDPEQIKSARGNQQY